MADGRRVVVGVRLSDDLAGLLDEVRGDVPRSAWVEAAIREKLAEAGAVPAGGKRGWVPAPPPKARPGAVEVPKFREPRLGAAEPCPHRNWGRYCGSCERLNDAKGMPAA